MVNPVKANIVVLRNEPSKVYILLHTELAEINLFMNSHLHEWIIDSCSSFHVTSNKLSFDHLHEQDHGHVVA